MDIRLMKKDEQEFLKNYKAGNYKKPSVTSDILIFTTEESRLQILLIKRGAYPYKNYWALPGGFVQMKESTLEGAKRELKEETGIEGVHLEQLYTFSEPDRDPRMRIISVAYIATVPKKMVKNHKSGDDANASQIFDIFVDKNGEMQLLGENDGLILNESDLAFDHKKIIKMALERLKGKANYSTICFEFLNDKKNFTLRELQKIFKAITGEKENFSNFRKRIKRMFEEEMKVILQTERIEKTSERGNPSKYWELISD